MYEFGVASNGIMPLSSYFIKISPAVLELKHAGKVQTDTTIPVCVHFALIVQRIDNNNFS
jgi:hypothetical protein